MSATTIFRGTREEWANRMIAEYVPMLAELGIEPSGDRRVRVAVTPLPSSKLGLCRPSSKSATGDVNFIDLSTVQADAGELAHTLLHELLHAFDDCHSGHRGRWKRWADHIGIRVRGHERGPTAERLVDDALRAVGYPAEHVTSVRKQKVPGSQVRVVCPVCSNWVYIPRKRFEQGYRVRCALDGALLLQMEEQREVA